MKAIIYVEGKTSPPFENVPGGTECIESNLLQSLPAAVYEELELIDVLEFDENEDILLVALQKLRHGGLIRITGTDALQVMKESEAGRVGIAESSKHLLNGRLRMTAAHELKEKLSSLQMNITAVSIGAFRYLVEATRQ